MPATRWTTPTSRSARPTVRNGLLPSVLVPTCVRPYAVLAHAAATILRLHSLLEWIQETLQELPKLRTGPIAQFEDRLFLTEINSCIREAQVDAAYLYLYMLRVACGSDVAT